MLLVYVKHLTQSVDTCRVIYVEKSTSPGFRRQSPGFRHQFQGVFSVDLEFPRFASYQVGRSGQCQFISSNLNLSNPILSVY